MVQTEACNFIKKENLAQVFSCEFCQIFKNTFFTEHLETASVPNDHAKQLLGRVVNYFFPREKKLFMT